MGVINRSAFCGYLKKTFVNEGNKGLAKYKEYLTKESSKKKNSLERNMELQEQLNTFEWWSKNIKGLINVDNIKQARINKEKRLLDKLFNDLLAQKITFEDIKSPIYKEILQKRWDDEIPF